MDNVAAAKLEKMLRMLTSSHEGEVLAAANRINAIAAAHDVDWGIVLGAPRVDLTKEAMDRIYQAGYERGKADAAPAADDWAPAGTARTNEVGSDLGRARAIIAAANKAVVDGVLSSFEVEFSLSMGERLQSWGRQAFVSERQWAVLERMERKLQSRGYMQ